MRTVCESGLTLGREIQSREGIKAVHVPGNTTPEAIADTVAGRTTYLITPISYALADICQFGMGYGCAQALRPEWWTN